MRTIPAGLLTLLQSDALSSAFGILVQRTDGTQLALTSADINCIVTGVPINGAALSKRMEAAVKASTI